MSKAEKFYAFYDLKDTDVGKGDIVISERDLFEVMEAYHQSRVNGIDWDKIETKFRKYRNELDGVQTLSAFLYFLKHNEIFKQLLKK